MKIISYQFVPHSEILKALGEKFVDYAVTPPLAKLETILLTRELKSLSVMQKLQTSICTIANLESKSSGLGILFPGENEPQKFGLSDQVIEILIGSGYDRVTKVMGLVNNVHLHSTVGQTNITLKLRDHLTEIFGFVGMVDKIFETQKK